eukprot:scaffold630_cov399-Prasinococcus_capsulatus_cf.AAC.11
MSWRPPLLPDGMGERCRAHPLPSRPPRRQRVRSLAGITTTLVHTPYASESTVPSSQSWERSSSSNNTFLPCRVQCVRLISRDAHALAKVRSSAVTAGVRCRRCTILGTARVLGGWPVLRTRGRTSTNASTVRVPTASGHHRSRPAEAQHLRHSTDRLQRYGAAARRKCSAAGGGRRHPSPNICAREAAAAQRRRRRSASASLQSTNPPQAQRVRGEGAPSPATRGRSRSPRAAGVRSAGRQRVWPRGTAQRAARTPLRAPQRRPRPPPARDHDAEARERASEQQQQRRCRPSPSLPAATRASVSAVVVVSGGGRLAGAAETPAGGGRCGVRPRA